MINFRSVKRMCCEDPAKIENYEKAAADCAKTWHLHHRLEVQGTFYNSKSLLIKLGLYWKRPASELVFLTPSEHTKLHNYSGERNGMYGKRHSDETKTKMRRHIRSEDHRRKLSIAARRKRRSAEELDKFRAAIAGRHWYNDGENQVMSKSCPPGFKPGRLR